MTKCIGCGVHLQNNDPNLLGYTKVLDNVLCERCFRIRNYNEYKKVEGNNFDYINILKSINTTKDLVVLVVDIFNISKDLSDIRKYINNDILLVLTKRDILPKSCYDKNLLDYFNRYNLNEIDRVIISSNKNYNFDTLYDLINKYKKSNNVYVVGFTNSGKSTMINKIIYNYSNSDTVITTSNLPSTTIDTISVQINDNLTLIDTPGLLDNNNIINFLDVEDIKKVIPSKEIRPINFQIKSNQVILVSNILRLDLNKNSNITLYMSNTLNIERYYKDVDKLKNLKRYEFEVSSKEDIVIEGLGFIKFTKNTNVVLYTIEGVNVFLRNSLI